jgi:hypothetical protein
MYGFDIDFLGDHMSIKFSSSNIRSRFRYNFRQLAEFEKEPDIVEQKSRTMIILLGGFLIYCVLTAVPCILSRYYHGAVTNASIFLLFVYMSFTLLKTQKHTRVTINGSYVLCTILFFHFIMETDWSIGMDAFWLFILLLPFFTCYLAGVYHGTIAACAGLLLSFLLFHTPLINYLQPYGKNMTEWFTVIYLVVMISAAVIGYELTAYQIDKKVSEEKIAFYQKERTKRLREQLSIYESNEKTIRNYKHDIRHYNRVLAGFIKEKEYDKAAAYLKEFDSMLESVTAVSFCDNQIVNELLTIYASRCQKLGFKPRIKAIVPARFPMEETDLTSLVANALENAVESQSYVEEEKRYLQLDIIYDGRKLKLSTRNPSAFDTKFKENGLPISTRAVQSGIGTSQIKAIAEKYGGAASFNLENGVFTVKAVMTCI